MTSFADSILNGILAIGLLYTVVVVWWRWLSPCNTKSGRTSHERPITPRQRIRPTRTHPPA